MNDEATPVFNPAAPHHLKPKVRALRGFPAKHGENTLLGLADARQISDQLVLVAPAFQVVLPELTGERDIDGIVAKVGHGLTRPVLEEFVARLDHAGLLEGPTFQALLSKLREQFDQSPFLPPGPSAAVADQLVQQHLGESATDEQKAEHGPGALRAAMDAWMKQALDPVPDPAFDALPRAIFAPHLDYWRGWFNYAHSYGRMRVTDRPDRVVILGTNHFGMGTGVVGCDKGFQSPLGMSKVDAKLVEALKAKLGPQDSARLFADRFDHEREHSIELHVPWIQHVFGPDERGEFPLVFGALVHDPSHKNGESYDGNGLALDPFVSAMRGALDQLGGRTLIVASVDLSHVGASFGDKTPIAGEDAEATAFRERVLNHDREMLNLLAQGKVDELLTAMAWQQNPTRWCSLGAITATMRLTGSQSVKMLQYAAAGDQQGIAMVSSFSGVIP
jgi:AmmeMemoRadiSam system protein B